MVIQPQVQIQAVLNRAFANDLQVFDKYVGRRVVIEEGEVGANISTATLHTHGASVVELADCTRYQESLYWIANKVDYIKKHREEDEEKLKPHYHLPTRVLAKSQIASMQLLENVLQGLSEEEVFER